MQAVQVQPGDIQWPRLILPNLVGDVEEEEEVSVKVRLTNHTSQPNIEDIGQKKRGAKVKAELKIKKIKM